MASVIEYDVSIRLHAYNIVRSWNVDASENRVRSSSRLCLSKGPPLNVVRPLVSTLKTAADYAQLAVDTAMCQPVGNPSSKMGAGYRT